MITMGQWQEHFWSVVCLDEAEAIEAFLKRVPARWVVCMLCDAQDRPVQLLCVRNLRSSLKNRMTVDPAAGPSKRVDYRSLVRRVHYRPVDSAFEADWHYLLIARIAFGQTYRGFLGFQPAWFIHVDPAARFPRYIRTTDLSQTTGEYLGPLADKHAAQRLIQLIEDAFDLCRYYNVLTEAPDGRACAYKEMHRCPAPCDGSIVMDQYRLMIHWSLSTLKDPRPELAQQQRRMHTAAEEHRFELAGQIHEHIKHLEKIGKGPYAQVRPLNAFSFLVIQRGPRDGTAKVFLVLPGGVIEVAGLISEPAGTASLLRHILELAAEHQALPMDDHGAEMVGLVSHHLFAGKRQTGVFVAMETLEPRVLVKAWRDCQKQAAVPEEESADGKVDKELVHLEPIPSQPAASGDLPGELPAVT